jgi:hypothetical protein
MMNTGLDFPDAIGAPDADAAGDPAAPAAGADRRAPGHKAVVE